jgi:hypothetical protein
VFQNLNLLIFKTQGSQHGFGVDKNVRHGGARIVKVECAFIPYALILEFLHDDFEAMKAPQWSGTFISGYHHEKM